MQTLVVGELCRVFFGYFDLLVSLECANKDEHVAAYTRKSIIVRHLIRLFKSLRFMGFWAGSHMFSLYLLHRLFVAKRWSVKSVRSPLFSSPIYLRPGVSDWIVFERVLFDAEYDCGSDEHNAAAKRLEASIISAGRKPLIIDCGANIGLASIWLGKSFPSATIAAIEPEEGNFDILLANAGTRPNIRPIRAAVGDGEAKVTMVNNSGTPWAWRTVFTDGAQGLPTMTVKGVIEAFEDTHTPMALKMDIEGFETIALRNGADWIDAIPIVIFEMHDWLAPWGGSGHAFFSILSRKPRDYLIKGENVFAFSTSLESIESPNICAQCFADVTSADFSV